MNKIKEKLLKEIEKYKKEDGTVAYDECGNYLGVYNWGRIITILEAKLQQHEETSKAKDEEELEFLQNILTLKKFPDERLIRTEIVYRIQKIKQRIKEEWQN